MKLESERLIIRDALMSDAPFYFELFNDPDWIQFIGDKNLKSIEETEVYLKETLFKNLQLGGLGFFTVISKETNRPIGASTALQRDKLAFIDIGYAFLPIGRGNGYATEATKLIIEYVRSKFKQEKVLALTMPENEKSQKLLKKLGFNYIGMQQVFENTEDCVFEYIF
ncbi:GNAT family N-acetyltransferase [Tenacibaculum caenipelagi]|uniref:RimJ/RimL family protein N-acetyltransferase n=1 Tax=Tenacibaculum caenipelagi TaxID=1325435 RepID=A0A4R6TE41_9FLAO|nr:GNAT family N-acetyltransferase [Tenacibaculum caenipelagi]TDQ22723.1 RimJ/RimL family protein N-acetyltransferase [Tenacibaculum caenipelagi]